MVLRVRKVWRDESYISYVFVGLNKSMDLKLGSGVGGRGPRYVRVR